MTIDRRYRETLAKILTTEDARAKQALIERFGLQLEAEFNHVDMTNTVVHGNAQYVAVTDIDAMRTEFETFRTVVQDKLHDLSKINDLMELLELHVSEMRQAAQNAGTLPEDAN